VERRQFRAGQASGEVEPLGDEAINSKNLTDQLLSELLGYTLSVGRELMSGSPDIAGEGQILYSGKAQFTGAQHA
jgi:hypothetical protein